MRRLGLDALGYTYPSIRTRQTSLFERAQLHECASSQVGSALMVMIFAGGRTGLNVPPDFWAAFPWITPRVGAPYLLKPGCDYTSLRRLSRFPELLAQLRFLSSGRKRLGEGLDCR